MASLYFLLSNNGPFVSLLGGYIFLHLFLYSSWTWQACLGFKQTFVMLFCLLFIFLNTLQKDRCLFQVDLLFWFKFPLKFSIILVLSPDAFCFGCCPLQELQETVLVGKTYSCLCWYGWGMGKGWWGASALTSPAMQKGCQNWSSSTIF